MNKKNKMMHGPQIFGSQILGPQALGSRSFLLTLAILAVGFLLSSCEDVEPVDTFIEDADAPETPFNPAVNPLLDPFAKPNGSTQTDLPVGSQVQDSESLPAAGCGDGVCQPSETKCTCPLDCGSCQGDASPLTEFRCVDGKCRIVSRQNVCGNGVCESGESSQGCEADCPACEPDNSPCTKDAFDAIAKVCAHDPVVPCCGNQVCEPAGESHACLIDCKDSLLSLSDYPKPFVENLSVNTLIVIGSQGTGASVTAGIDIIRAWEYNGSRAGYDTKARLDKEVDSLDGKNVILIGSACENTHVSALMKPVRDCRDGLEPGVGLLRLYQTGPQTYGLVVAGYSSEDTRRAAKVLEKFKDFGLKGYQVEVR